MYLNLAAVKNLGGIKNVYWWKVPQCIFYITHGQTPCLQWGVGYRQAGWQWPELYKDSKPTASASVLPVSLHRAVNSSNSPAPLQLWNLCPAGRLTPAPWLPGTPLCWCAEQFSPHGALCHVTALAILVLTYSCAIERDKNYQSWRLNFLGLFKSGFSQSPLWLAADDIRIKRISVQPSPLGRQVGSPITSTSFSKSRRY